MTNQILEFGLLVLCACTFVIAKVIESYCDKIVAKLEEIRDELEETRNRMPEEP
jgi:hypothetical protein